MWGYAVLIRLWVQLQRLKADRRAVTSIEYVLIASLVATVIIDGVTHIGEGLLVALQRAAAGL